MLQQILVIAALTLLPNVSMAQLVEDRVEDHLERELRALEEEGQNQGPPRRNLLGLMGRPGVVQQGEGLLPGLNPAVNMKLANMDQQMNELKDRQGAAVHVRENLEGDVKDAITHMNSVSVIKTGLARTEVAIRQEERQMKKLAEDKLHLDMTHHSLSSSLHHIMEPKISFAEKRLQKRRRKLHMLEAKEADWKKNEQKFHASSLAALDERDKSKASLEEALVAEEKAHQERMQAEKQFRAAKKSTNFNIQGYRYAEEENRGATRKEQRGAEEEREAKASVKRLNHIMHMEQKRVDESMAIGKDKVQGKMRKVEAAEKASNEKLANLKQEFAEWQDQQGVWANRIENLKHGTHLAAKDFADGQETILASARNAMIKDAQDDSDWAWDGDDWAGDTALLQGEIRNIQDTA